jgi:hypothetical protein
MASAAKIESGVVLAGRYRVVSRLGVGGMASVLMAEDPVLERRVAVKRLRHGSEPADARRFRREARLGARLNHPNIVSVFDVVEGEDELLIVMEYVPGEPLSELIRTRQLGGPRLAVKVLRGVAAALDHAHSNGVVHRDVKPSNVLVRDDGTVKLAGRDPAERRADGARPLLPARALAVIGTGVLGRAVLAVALNVAGGGDPVTERSRAGAAGADGGANRAGRPAGEEKDLGRSTTAGNPDPVEGARLNDEGYALIQQGSYEEAVPILRRAVASFPRTAADLSYAYALYNLGHALRLSGRPDDAVPILERRLEIPNQIPTVERELEAARDQSTKEEP